MTCFIPRPSFTPNQMMKGNGRDPQRSSEIALIPENFYRQLFPSVQSFCLVTAFLVEPIRGPIYGSGMNASMNSSLQMTLPRVPEWLHSAIPDCLRYAPGGKKFDQSF